MDERITQAEYDALSDSEKAQFKPVLGPIQYSHKLKRNLGCPCNSGKKYKKCCWFTRTVDNIKQLEELNAKIKEYGRQRREASSSIQSGEAR